MQNLVDAKMMQAALERHAKLRKEALTQLGRATQLRCTCGGHLHEKVPAALALEKLLPKPVHRKKRILKKRLRVWQARAMLLQAVAQMGMRSGFICGSCGKREGFYRAIGHNLIQVEPMPPALPCYDREPSV